MIKQLEKPDQESKVESQNAGRCFSVNNIYKYPLQIRVIIIY